MKLNEEEKRKYKLFFLRNKMTAGLYFSLTVRLFLSLFFFVAHTPPYRTSIDCLLTPCISKVLPLYFLFVNTIVIITCEFNLSNLTVTYMRPWARTANFELIWICGFSDEVIVDKDMVSN
jgi:hypothetical protein